MVVHPFKPLLALRVSSLDMEADTRRRLIDGPLHLFDRVPHGSRRRRHNDVPGVIGRVGTLLGAHSLNIAEYIQSREAKGGLALAAVSVDGRVSPEFLETLSEDEDILDARAVYFDG